ncbi:MAG TPA: low specificity L-threonine aldolase, partial [Rhizobiaceae bacterium]|nr:low specificity L-threonine aldolase [Rhizobiaceae bacterium]
YIEDSSNMRLAWKPQANEVFALMTASTAEMLQSKGVKFHEWKIPVGFDASAIKAGERLWRFVTSFATTKNDIEAFGRLIE